MGLAFTIAMFGEGLGINANAEAPTGAQSTAAVSTYKLASPITLREPRPQIASAVSSIPVTVERSYPFVWPAAGPITNYMGPVHPAGIDIGLEHELEPIIRATAGGVVSFAGGSDSLDYGFYTVVDHGNGITSLYAHLDRHLVRQGERVEQGQALGIGGNTGKSTGKHLHFEISIHDSRIDPMSVLPTHGGDVEALDFDCMAAGLLIDAGAQVAFDFNRAIQGDGEITGVEIRSEGGEDSVGINAQAVTPTKVRISTALDIGGPQRDYAHNLIVSIEEQGQRRELDCELTVRVTPVPTAFYVRQAPTPEPGEMEPEIEEVEQIIKEEPVVEEPVPEEPTPEPTLEIPDVPILGTVEPTETPEATATPEPTATLEPEPTATTEPTATLEPEPTATLEPEPTATTVAQTIDEGDEADE